MPSNLHIERFQPLVSPSTLKEELPLTQTVSDTVERAVGDIRQIMYRQDERLLIVVGPCSIHDPKAASEYASRLVKLAQEMASRLVIVMRTFFEKPRTTVGWPGLIADPHMNGSDDGEEGLRRARQLLLEINSLGLATAMEVIDPIAAQFIDDLLSLATIGARTSEAPTQRKLASGLSAPIGFKNGTDGNIQVAVDALIAAPHPHSFFGVDEDGRSAVVHTTGNPDGILILRGGRNGPNYDADNVIKAGQKLEEHDLPSNVMVDCNHANSGGNPKRQEEVWRQVIDQLPETRGHLIGLMAESFLSEGKQPFQQSVGPGNLDYGVSVTDACMSWESTERMLRYTYEHATR